MSESILSWMISTALLGFSGPVLTEDGPTDDTQF